MVVIVKEIKNRKYVYRNYWEGAKLHTKYYGPANDQKNWERAYKDEYNYLKKMLARIEAVMGKQLEKKAKK